MYALLPYGLRQGARAGRSSAGFQCARGFGVSHEKRKGKPSGSGLLSQTIVSHEKRNIQFHRIQAPETLNASVCGAPHACRRATLETAKAVSFTLPPSPCRLATTRTATCDVTRYGLAKAAYC